MFFVNLSVNKKILRKRTLQQVDKSRFLHNDNFCGYNYNKEGENNSTRTPLFPPSLLIPNTKPCHPERY